MAWCKPSRSSFAVVVSALALTASGCEKSDCDDRRAEALSQTFGVKIHCSGSLCRASLSVTNARRLSAGLPRGKVTECSDVSSQPDAKSSAAALGDPCCNAGGSACTHFYTYVVSESARALCVVL